MVSFRTHLTALASAASQHPSSPVFKVPRKAGIDIAWVPITYEDFLADVELVAKYWSKTLKSDGVPPKSVVGLW